MKATKKLDLKILRIYSSAVEKKDYPGAKLETHHQRSNAICPDWAKPYALHHMIRQAESGGLVHLEEKLREMRENGQIPSGKLCNDYRAALRKAEEKFFQDKRFDVVFCTCNEASGARVRKNVSPRLCQCIIDECGMANEPETIVTIGLCEHAVLIGDHKQLQPVIDYRPAKENGLSISLFERYAECEEKAYHIFTLKTQYRMV